MFSWYSQYRGQSYGRILHYVNIYCGLRYAEEVAVYTDKITYHDNLLATFSWEGDTDRATFKFCYEDRFHPRFNYNAESKQLTLNKYIDEFVCNVEYIVGEIRCALIEGWDEDTITWFAFRLCRKHEFNWNAERRALEVPHLIDVAKRINQLYDRYFRGV
jgi:hypothetical protein